MLRYLKLSPYRYLSYMIKTIEIIRERNRSMMAHTNYIEHFGNDHSLIEPKSV